MKRSSLCIVVCESFRHEMAALARELQFSDVEFLTYPARCARPPLQPEEFSSLIDDPGRFDKIVLLGSGCLDHLTCRGEAAGRLHRVRLKHCFSLLLGDYAIEKYLAQGAYLVNSGWLCDCEKQVAAGSFIRSESILHLDTGVLDAAPGCLSAFGSVACRPQQTVPVGLDLLKSRIEHLVHDWRAGLELAREREALQQCQRRGADHAMALDLLKMIVQTTGSKEVMREILLLYVKLFAAGELAFVRCDGDRDEVIRIGSGPSDSDEMLQKRALELDDDFAMLPSGAGFQLRVAHKGQLLGMIHIGGIGFTQNLQQYLDLALETVTVCAVVLDNSFSFDKVFAISHQLMLSEDALEEANRQLEERVQARTAELEAALREQASFSYSVSHDLRAPLRHINSFATILLEEYAAHLPGEAGDYLGRICQSTKCMGELIDSLLELSRVCRAETEMKAVDLAHLAMCAVTLLQDRDATHAPRFCIEEGVNATGDPALLRQVLFNLLGNAWKFTAGRPDPRIEFGRTRVEGRDAFYVRDNGVGFDMAYSEKLFEVFQRLHGSEFDGHGIGLATAQRIIQRHGGSMWAEGKVNQGATFYFTLQEPGKAATATAC